jgi:hypothetical protein
LFTTLKSHQGSQQKEEKMKSKLLLLAIVVFSSTLSFATAHVTPEKLVKVLSCDHNALEIFVFADERRLIQIKMNNVAINHYFASKFAFSTENKNTYPTTGDDTVTVMGAVKNGLFKSSDFQGARLIVGGEYDTVIIDLKKEGQGLKLVSSYLSPWKTELNDPIQYMIGNQEYIVWRDIEHTEDTNYGSNHFHERANWAYQHCELE